MNYFDLPDGNRMPALGLGTWKSEPGVVGGVVREAIRTGYRHFDCAPIYGNEAEIGEAVQASITAGVLSPVFWRFPAGSATIEARSGLPGSLR